MYAAAVEQCVGVRAKSRTRLAGSGRWTSATDFACVGIGRRQHAANVGGVSGNAGDDVIANHDRASWRNIASLSSVRTMSTTTFHLLRQASRCASDVVK